MDPRKANDLYRQLALDAYAQGGYEECLDWAAQVKSPMPADLQEAVCHAAYRRGIELAAQRQYGDAIARIDQAHRLALQLGNQQRLLQLCEARKRLLKQVAGQPRLSNTACPICSHSRTLDCPRCLAPDALRPEVDAVFCVGAYRSGYDPDRSNPYSQLIRRMKEAGGEALAAAGAMLLSHFVEQHLAPSEWADADLMVPVPTNAARFAQRGYSIPLALSGGLARHTTVPDFPDLVVLTRDTRDLRSLARWQRASALAGAFALSNPALVDGLAVLIVDDVVTAGTTMREIARVLRAARARKVVGLALAHTEHSDTEQPA